MPNITLRLGEKRKAEYGPKNERPKRVRAPFGPVFWLFTIYCMSFCLLFGFSATFELLFLFIISYRSFEHLTFFTFGCMFYDDTPKMLSTRDTQGDTPDSLWSLCLLLSAKLVPNLL